MDLSNQLRSLYDETVYGDAFSRTSSLFRIETNRTSYGGFTGGDYKDYFTINPGVGDFALFVTADRVNGFSTSAATYEFDVKITDSSGSVLLTSTTYDLTTRAVAFHSSSTGPYYVEITNTLFKTFSYAATLKLPIANPSTITGDGGDNVLNGAATADVMFGLGGADTIHGGAGDDIIDGGSGPGFLRGDEGDDLITGGSDFDDTHGNMGNDTISGGGGGDWVVGGKDNDLLFGEDDADVVWGNLGNDTHHGGDGNDQVRGGQGDDIVNGDAGDDYVSGDRGNDTISGGTGADRFHGSQDAGVDRVLDFNRLQGDRVLLDPGTTYTVGQVGADTVIDMGAGHQMILVGVQYSSLTEGWIVSAWA